MQLVTQRGEQMNVEKLQLDLDLNGHLTVDLGEGETAVFMISGLTRWTTERAEYRYAVTLEEGENE